MSKHKEENHLNSVSNSKIDINGIKKSISKDNTAVENDYKIFCERYRNQNFDKYTLERLKNLYEVGNGLLNQYFIIGCNFDNNIFNQLQHIVNHIIYNINIQQASNIAKQNRILNSKLEKEIQTVSKLSNEINKKNIEIKKIKNDVKSITTTIISIILSISIIPTAIAGIDKISPNYILPFLSSVILFGIIMIAFIYSIYQDKLKISTWGVLIIAIIICAGFWYSSCYTNIQKELKEENQNIQNQIEEANNS